MTNDYCPTSLCFTIRTVLTTTGSRGRLPLLLLSVGARQIESTTFMPSMTLPKIEYWPSHFGAATAQIKNWLVPPFGSFCGFQAVTVPRTCLSVGDSSAAIFFCPGCPMPQVDGSP